MIWISRFPAATEGPNRHQGLQDWKQTAGNRHSLSDIANRNGPGKYDRMYCIAGIQKQSMKPGKIAHDIDGVSFVRR